MATVLHDCVAVERDGAVAVITIAHPPANAISRAVIAGIGEALTTAEADASCNAVIITGQGERFFAAGADIKEFLDAGGAAIAGGQDLTLRMEASRLPIVAAVNGMAFGGGCEIALACDIRLASSAARFGQPEINLGIIPGWGGTQRLPRIIGRGPAMPLLLSGNPIDAAEALRLGLVSQVFEPDALMAGAIAYAAHLAARAPLAMAATKRAIANGLDRPLDAGLAAEREEFVSVFATADAREGVTAFLEKRVPVWGGN